MTRYTPPGGGTAVKAEQIQEAGPVLVYDQRGEARTEYACAGDFVVHWPDSSTSILGQEEFMRLFPRSPAPPTPDETDTMLETVSDSSNLMTEERHGRWRTNSNQ